MGHDNTGAPFGQVERNAGDIALEFLNWLDPNGTHALAAISPQGGPPEAATFPPARHHEIPAWVDARDGRLNLYYSVNEPRADLGPNKARKADITRLRAVFADLDPRPGHDLASERARIEAAMETSPVPFGAIVDSGGGYQGLALLNEKMAATPEAQRWIEEHGRGLATALGGDNVQNIDRVLRLPGTMNIPNEAKRAKGRIERQARLVKHTGARVTRDDIARHVTPLAAPVTREGEDAAIAAAILDVEHSGFDAAYRYDELPDDLRARFENDLTQDGTLARLWQDGEINGPDKSGSALRFKLAGRLKHLGGYSCEDYAALAWVWDRAGLQSKGTRDDVVRQLGRDWGRADATHAPPDCSSWFSPVPEAERNETVIEQRLARERAEYQAAQADGLGKADVKAAPDFPHDPVDLWGRFDPPALPADLLPRVIEDFARIQGNQMGADPAGIAVAALVTSAAAIPDGVRLKLKRHDRWSESARLWAALVGTPSTKKSPILSVATEPLCEIDNNLFREWQAQKTLWDGLDKKERKGRDEPKQRRLRLGDTTPEAAQMVLENSPDGVLLLQDELSGFFGAMDKYNGGKGASADRAFWLTSFNGGQYALNRAGRGSALIPNLSVCLLGGIQPEPIRKVAGDTNDDGLLQRLFPIVLRPATMGRDEPAADVVGEYGALVRRLNQLVPTTAPLMFDDGAMKIREGLERKHLELQTTEIVNRKLASHVGKYDGLFARLCIVWHCIEHAYAPKLPGVVSKATAERVGAFLHGFLLKHAFAFYGGVLGLSDDHDDLTAIAGHILSKRLEKVAHRDVQRGTQSMKKLTERDTRPLFEQLAAIGWLEKIDGPRPSSAPHWLVNPHVHVRFADHAAAERDRRARAREVLTSLGQSEHANLNSPDLLEEAAIFG